MRWCVILTSRELPFNGSRVGFRTNETKIRTMNPSPTPPCSKPIVLVGLMGAGKSSIGRRVAGALAVPFIDTDTEITEAAGCSIADIFNKYGEAAFRDVEAKVFGRIVQDGVRVIASGGGAFINPTIRSLLGETCICIWLRADLETLLERTSRKNTRPLLETGDPRKILSDLIEHRYPIYEEADIIVDSENCSHELTVDKVMQALRDYQEGSSHEQ